MFKGLYGLPERIRLIGFGEFSISEITLAELIFGAYKSNRVEQNLAVVYEFARNVTILPIIGALDLYGQEKARLRSLGQPIGDLDLFKGTTALANGLTVVTRNVREFQRIQNLNVENCVASIESL
jgi:tRNA(fMet)-specific endonuclease VapC